MTPFDFVAEALEARSSLSRLEARGTLRIALRQAGLGGAASATEMEVVLRKLMPGELATRGVEGAEGLCEEIARLVAGRSFEARSGSSPEEVFRRLGGS